jgi:DNA polymerase alpha subunit A
MVKGGLWFSWLARVRSVLTFLMSLIEPVVPMTACSQNIAQIFGTNTTAFELLVLKRKIMGPCWIQIRHPEVDNKGVASLHL